MSTHDLLLDAFMFFLATVLISVFCGAVLAIGRVVSEWKGGQK